MLDEWLTCQGKWLYLEPIFGAEEIMKQIPKEGSAFRSMDASWRSIMAQVRLGLASRAAAHSKGLELLVDVAHDQGSGVWVCVSCKMPLGAAISSVPLCGAFLHLYLVYAA
jgi:hypothetical protein